MNNTTGNTTPAEAFRMAIAASGMQPPDAIIPGALQRFSPTGRHGDLAGWYVFYGDGIPSGAFGNWREATQSTWCIKADHEMTDTEREAHHQRMQAARQQRDTDKSAQQEAAAKAAITRWDASQPATGHPYLTAKGIKPHAARIDGETLLIPLRDVRGKLWNLQQIYPDGTKRFLPGGKVSDCYCTIGQSDGALVIAEGFATGASIHEATGRAVAVAFSASNLPKVALALRARYPDMPITIAADDDHQTAGNPGLTKGTQAAQAIGGWLAKPLFPPERADRDTDFNDLARLAGADAVVSRLDAAVYLGKPFELKTDAAMEEGKTRVLLTRGTAVKPTPIHWLWHGWLARGKLAMLAGQPGVGKTTIALALAARVTTGKPFPDGTSCKPGNVLIWSGEDDPADTLMPRLLAAGADPSRVYFVEETHRMGELLPFDPARDMGALAMQMDAMDGVSLLILDPIAQAIAGDSHKAGEVRRGLQPVIDLATRQNTAVIGISHLSKAGAAIGADPALRLLGSVAFLAVTRVLLLAAKMRDLDGSEYLGMLRAKSNIGKNGGGWRYSIRQTCPIPEIEASLIEWGDAIEGSAADLMNVMPDDPEAEDQHDAAALLKAELTADCWTDSALASKPLLAAGFTKKQIWKATKKLEVIRHKAGFGKDFKVHWRLPGGPENCPITDSTSTNSLSDSTYSPFRKKESVESVGKVESVEGDFSADSGPDSEEL